MRIFSTKVPSTYNLVSQHKYLAGEYLTQSNLYLDIHITTKLADWPKGHVEICAWECGAFSYYDCTSLRNRQTKGKRRRHWWSKVLHLNTQRSTICQSCQVEEDQQVWYIWHNILISDRALVLEYSTLICLLTPNSKWYHSYETFVCIQAGLLLCRRFRLSGCSKS